MNQACFVRSTYTVWWPSACLYTLVLLVSLSTSRQLLASERAAAGEEGLAKSQFQCWSTPDDLPHYVTVTHPCFSQQGAVQCRCDDVIQDCSSNAGNLTFVPRVSDRGVQALNFSNNDPLRVDSGRFFFNVSRHPLWLVDLYNNNMTYLPAHVFSPLPRLTTVLIGGNRLSYEALRRAVFSVPTLRKLDIKCGGLGAIPPGYFNNTAAVHLEELDMSWNPLMSLDMAVFQPLVHLRHVTLWHNGLYRLEPAYLPSLQYISFHKNLIQVFPKTCRDNTNDSLFPNLLLLDLNYNRISNISGPVCLPRLRTLNLQYNIIQSFYRDMFSDARFPALERLLLNRMEGRVEKLEAYAFNNSRVKEIAFGMDFFQFFSSAASPDAFAGCDNVRILFLHYTVFSGITVEKFQRLFKPMPRLEMLSLQSTKLGAVSREAFKYLNSLKVLDLSDNQLFSIPDGVFDDLIHLRELNLSGNHLTGISSETFGPATRARLRWLDLSGNPFDCSCDISWFQAWMRKYPKLFPSLLTRGYFCANLHNVTVPHFVINEQACLLSKLAANDIIIVFSIVLGIVCVFFLAFGYRWQLRLWLYEVCRGRYERRRRHEERLLRHFQYDVFLAYAEEDGEWVKHTLLPVLERELELSVCLHERDFVPGKHIIDNITDCVSDSDRLLMVFSPHFARSPWCQFELRLCQIIAMERDDVMVVVMLEETEARDLTGAMLAVMRTTTYLEWAEEPGARVSFFGRLKLALNDVIKQ